MTLRNGCLSLVYPAAVESSVCEGASDQLTSPRYGAQLRPEPEVQKPPDRDHGIFRTQIAGHFILFVLPTFDRLLRRT